MSYKEILAIVLAVIAVCAVVALTKLVRGTGNENSAPEITTVSTTVTTVTTSYWDKLRQDQQSSPSSTQTTTDEYEFYDPDVTSVSVVPDPFTTQTGAATVSTDQFQTMFTQPTSATSTWGFSDTAFSSSSATTVTTAESTQRPAFYTIVIG